MKVAQQMQAVRTTDLEPVLIFWCPACGSRHRISVAPGRWTWNGDENSPTFSPSVKVQWNFGEERTPNVCHFNVEAGVIHYLHDSTHSMRDQKIPMHDVDSHGESLVEFPNG